MAHGWKYTARGKEEQAALHSRPVRTRGAVSRRISGELRTVCHRSTALATGGLPARLGVGWVGLAPTGPLTDFRKGIDLLYHFRTSTAGHTREVTPISAPAGLGRQLKEWPDNGHGKENPVGGQGEIPIDAEGGPRCLLAPKKRMRTYQLVTELFPFNESFLI